MNDYGDGLGIADWVGALITSAGSAVAGGVASRIASGGQSEQTRQAIERSLTFEWEMRRQQQQQQSQMMTMMGLGLGALVVVSMLR